MPPIKAALTSPPNIRPSTLTPMDSTSMTGNTPCKSSFGEILMPFTAPLKVRPFMPLISVTSADRISTKSPGSFSISSHWIPISVIRMGRKEGHLKDAPVALPTPMKTPNPRLVTKVPSPRNAKLRASPESSNPPIVTIAPIAPKETISSVSPAPVFNMKSTAVKVTKVPSLISSVSTSNLKASTRPLLKLSVKRIASSSCVPSAFTSVASLRSFTVPETALPGKKRAPPVAT